jgi:hypothetical protein
MATFPRAPFLKWHMLQSLVAVPQVEFLFLWQAFVQVAVVVLYLMPGAATEVIFVILLLCVLDAIPFGPGTVG